MFQRVRYYSGNPLELFFLFQMKVVFKEFKPSEERLELIGKKTSDKEFCSEALKKVSRSFSVVIHQLPEKLQAPVGLFYLILRGLDTVEDDMSLDELTKKNLLADFANKINEKEFSFDDIGDTQDYKDLMRHFDKVIREYQLLDEPYKEVITDITNRMAFGMNKYLDSDVKSFEDWNDYCHYVAGLVGIGLSKLFLISGVEKDERLNNEYLSNEMGLFLQKTNIIRDYAEDVEQTRIFWPSDAWDSEVQAIGDLQKDPEKGVRVINDLIENALSHIPACLEYLAMLKDEKVLRFCAIPQLMAAATLRKLVGNKLVLTQNVKIRKGRTARYFMMKHDFQAIVKEFRKTLVEIDRVEPRSSVKKLIKEVDSKYGAI